MKSIKSQLRRSPTLVVGKPTNSKDVERSLHIGQRDGGLVLDVEGGADVVTGPAHQLPALHKVTLECSFDAGKRFKFSQSLTPCKAA